MRAQGNAHIEWIVCHTLGAVFNAYAAFAATNDLTMFFSFLLDFPKNSVANPSPVRTLLRRSGCLSMLRRMRPNACASGCQSPPAEQNKDTTKLVHPLLRHLHCWRNGTMNGISRGRQRTGRQSLPWVRVCTTEKCTKEKGGDEGGREGGQGTGRSL